MKRCSKSSVIKEIQIKTTMRYNFTSAIIKKMITSLDEHVEKENLNTLLVGM